MAHRQHRRYLSRILFLGTLAATLWTSVPAASQVSMGALGGGNSGSDTRLDYDSAYANALQSFIFSATSTREARLSSATETSRQQRQQITDETDKTIQEFERNLQTTLNELRGDGVLTASEIEEPLNELRTQYLGRLKERIGAQKEGAPQPPVAGDSKPIHVYLQELFEYTLFVRNGWLRWGSMLLAIILGLGAARLVSLLIRTTASHARHGNRRVMADALTSLNGPLYLAFSLCGIAVGLNWIWLPVNAADFVWLTVRLLLSFSIFWLVWNICGLLAELAGHGLRRSNNKLDKQMVDLMRKSFRLFVLVAFILFVTEVMLETDLRGLLAGIGILGLAVTFAAHDSLKNIVAAFTIYADKPFRVGDLVKYRDYFGYIEDIGFRAVRLRILDGHLINIPNAQMVSEPIENVDARPYIRRDYYVEIPYTTTPDKVREAMDILRQVLSENENQPESEDYHVIFEKFGSYSLRLWMVYYYEPGDFFEAMKYCSTINLKIMERFHEAGIDFAFPTQRLYLDTEEDNPPALRLQGSLENGGSGSGRDSVEEQDRQTRAKRQQTEQAQRSKGKKGDQGKGGTGETSDGDA